MDGLRRVQADLPFHSGTRKGKFVALLEGNTQIVGGREEETGDG